MNTFPPDPPDYESPIGYSLFCEDIRHEHDGKYSLIGVFPGNIGVVSFPAVIPKLGIAVYYRQPSTMPRGEVNLCVMWEPDGAAERRLLVSTPVDMSEMPTPGAGAWLAAAVNMVMSPFQAAEPGSLRVRGYRDDLPPLRMGGIRLVRTEEGPGSAESPIVVPLQLGQPNVLKPRKL